MSEFKSHAFAMNTQKTYASHLRSYLSFCEKLNIQPVPVNEHVVALYATYLARTLRPASVRQYINIVRLLHLECGWEHPYKESWTVTSTLRGIDRVKGCEVRRKTPITPQVLLQIRDRLHLHKDTDAVLWAACLVLFFGLLRKSNLFPDKAADFDPNKQLTRDCFVLDDTCLKISVKWSKTIQRKEKTLSIELPCLYPHPLCPVSAVMHAFRHRAQAPPTSQAFPISGAEFNRRIKSLAGPSFSSHSFRRGGATHALTCGIPAAVIKVFGDWKSNVYLNYLDQLPSQTLTHYRHVFAANLPSTP